MYTKLVIHYKGRDIEFKAHEIVLLARQITRDYEFPKDIENQVFVPTFDQWFSLLRKLDEETPVEDIISGSLDPYITIPMHIQRIDSVSHWLFIARVLNRRFAEETDTVGTWINIGGHLVLVKNTEEMTYYVSDHGKLYDIITYVRDLAFGSLDWVDPHLMMSLVKVVKIYEEMTPEQKAEFKNLFAESIEGHSIEEMRTFYPDDWTDEEIAGSAEFMASDIGRLFLHMEESNRYIIQVLLKKYMEMKFSTHIGFDNQIYQNFGVYDEEGMPINETYTVHGVEKTWETRLSDARRYIKTIVLEYVAIDVNEGKQEQLFRPVYTFGNREKGATYHEFADAVITYLGGDAHLPEGEIARGIRGLLKGETFGDTEYPNFLPSLVGAWFLAESARSPTALLTGLILVDMIENNIELLDRFGHNWYSLPNTLVHPLKDSGEGKVADLYGGKKIGIDRFGGMHPMAHAGSESQGKEDVKSRTKLNPVQQKEASLLFHWLSLRLNAMGIENTLISNDDEPLVASEVEVEDEFKILKSELDSLTKKISKTQTTIRVKVNKAESSKKYEKILEKQVKEEHYLQVRLINEQLKFELVTNFLAPLLTSRLSNLDNLLEEKTSLPKKYIEISPYLEADERKTSILFKIYEKYPDQEIVEILPIALDGNCMYNSILQGLLRLPSTYTGYREFTLEELRERVANTIAGANAETLEDYRTRLTTQLFTAIIDRDIAGFNTELREQIINLSSNYFNLIREGLDENDIQEGITRAIQDGDLVDTYLVMIQENRAWGGNVELGIMAEILGVQIFVHRRDGQVIRINEQHDLPIINLDYDGGHYNLILNHPSYLQEAVPAVLEDEVVADQENVTDAEASSHEQALFFMATGGRFFESWDFS